MPNAELPSSYHDSEGLLKTLHDPEASLDSNYQHMKYFLMGYRDAYCGYHECPHHPDGAKARSWNAGHAQAVLDRSAFGSW